MTEAFFGATILYRTLWNSLLFKTPTFDRTVVFEIPHQAESIRMHSPSGYESLSFDFSKTSHGAFLGFNSSGYQRSILMTLRVPCNLALQLTTNATSPPAGAGRSDRIDVSSGPRFWSKMKGLMLRTFGTVSNSESRLSNKAFYTVVRCLVLQN